MCDLEIISRIVNNSSQQKFYGGGSASSSMPKALCITSTPLPCTAAAFEQLPPQKHFFLEMTVLSITSPGFTQVPISHVNGKFVQDRKIAKPLCEYVVDSNQTSARCYNWQKVASTFAKGPRIDGTNPNILEGKDMSWLLSAGDVIGCKIEAERAPGGNLFKAGEKAAFTFPLDVEGDLLPAFSLVEVDLDLKSWSSIPKDSEDAQVSACVKGYALGIRGVRPMEGSINSHKSVLSKYFPQAIEESHERQRTKGSQNDFVSGVFNDSKGCYYIPAISQDAYCSPSDEEDFIGLHEGISANHQKIDLLRVPTHRVLNVDGDLEANALLDIAIASGSLSVFGHQNEFRSRGGARSNMFAVPVVDVASIFQAMSTAVSVGDTTVVQFDAGFSMHFSEAVCKPVVIRVDREVTSNVGSGYPPSNDMPLVSSVFTVDKGYKTEIAFHDGGVIWSGYINACKHVASGSGANMVENAMAAGKRKTWGVVMPPVVPVAKKTKKP
jgi:hypothetical protein